MAEVEISQEVIAVEGARVYYQAAGQGHPLVLLHGLSGSARWWRKNIVPLARHFRVYALDLVGFGRSRGGRFMLRYAPEAVYRWLDVLGLQTAHVVGHSMGGFIAASLAASHPERVDRLVLVDALAVPIGRSVVRSAWGLVEALRYVPLDFLPVLFTDALRAGPITLLGAIHDIFRSEMTADLSAIEADTMIVWGGRDTLLPPVLGDALAKAMPKAAYVRLDRAGHNPMWDTPEAFNSLVTDFLARGARPDRDLPGEG